MARFKRLIPRAGTDALIVIAAYTVVYLIIPTRIFTQPWENTWLIFGVAATLVGSLYLFRVYQRIWARTSGHGIITIINAVTLPTVILALIVSFINPRPLSIATILFGNLLSLIGFVGIRYRSRLISGFAWRWQAWLGLKTEVDKRDPVLIVGAGESGQALAMRLKHRVAHQEYRIVGFIDDDPGKLGMYVEGCPVLGSREDIPAIVEREKIDLIIVAIHNISGQEFRDILNYCEHTTARIKVVPDILGQMNLTHHASLLRDVQAEDLLGRGAVTRHEAVNLAAIMNKTILITGAAGSIGSELSRQIMGYQPTQVVLVDNNESGLHDLSIELMARHKSIRIASVLGDITLRDSMTRVFEKYRPQVVFHAAAYKHVPLLEYHPAEALRVNILGTKIVADLACKYSVERFVLISTDKAVNPSSVMGASKRLYELLLHALIKTEDCPTLFTSVRFGNVLGSRGSVVPTFTHQIENGGPVTVTHPDMTRYFMTIPEAVNLIMHAAALTKGDDIFILQMGEVVRIVELAERLIRLRGLRPHQDIAIVYTGIRPGEKMHEELYTEAENPESTLHPHIIKLNTWHDDFVLADFWRKLDVLLSEPGHTASIVLEHLRSIIEVNSQVSERLA